MRMHPKKHLTERLQRCEGLYITQTEGLCGQWNSRIFQNQNPIHIEIGCGKGKFITETAKQHPEINYIAFEKYKNVLIAALEKTQAECITNIRFLSDDAADLLSLIAPGECERIYLNFSDPWPKSRHAKRRLTHPNFLTLYQSVLPRGGAVYFKTDNRGLFEYSLNSFSDFGLRLHNISLDLHNSGFEGNVETEYELQFSQQGFPIYRCEVFFD